MQLVPNPVQLLWDPEAVRTYPQLQQVKRSMMRWGNCYWYWWLLITLIISRWSEPTRVTAIVFLHVIFIFNSCHMKAKCVFPVNFCSFSEIILPWCLVISTKSPFSFPHIPILKPKVSRTCILSPSISKWHTNPAFLNVTIIGITWTPPPSLPNLKQHKVLANFPILYK